MFRHALVHEAVLNELLPGERTGLHAAFARAIEFDHGLVGSAWAAALVHHWTAAGRRERGVAPALAAAVDAELAYALPEAQRYYDWLLDTLDEGIDGPAADLPVTRAELVDRAADVASRAGDLDRAAQLIADALAGIDPRQEPPAPPSSTSGAAGACCNAAATTMPSRRTSRRSASSRSSRRQRHAPACWRPAPTPSNASTGRRRRRRAPPTGSPRR